jgi:hypothetical protein
MAKGLTKYLRFDRLGIALWAATLVGLLFFLFPIEIVKKGGDVLLIVPDSLGFVHRVDPAEIHSCSLQPETAVTVHLEIGRYLIYTDDIRILSMMSVLEANTNTATTKWLVVLGTDHQGKNTVLDLVTRGVRAYDTPYAAGRPILQFDITGAGNYRILNKMTGLGMVVSIVPDHTSGRGHLISILFLVQITIVILLIYGIYTFRTRKTRAARKHRQREQRLRADQLIALFPTSDIKPTIDND